MTRVLVWFWTQRPSATEIACWAVIFFIGFPLGLRMVYRVFDGAAFAIVPLLTCLLLLWARVLRCHVLHLRSRRGQDE